MNEELKIYISAEIGALKKELGQAKKETEDLEKKGGGALKKFGEAAKTCGQVVAGAMKAAAGAIVAGGAALIALSEGTKEYNTNQAKLNTAFESAGGSAETAAQTYNELYRVLGDDDVAVEAAGHLAQMTTNQEELSQWTETAKGVYATFGDSLPIEGLMEAANETAKVGTVTGGLADALNWAGISEDEFNAKLAACNSEAEREQLIRETLNSTYSEAASAYEENAKGLLDANEAQAKMTAALGEMGAAVTPIVTILKDGLATVLQQLSPFVTTISEGLQLMFSGDVAAGAAMLTEGVSGLVTTLANMITEMLPTIITLGIQVIVSLIEGIVQALPAIVTALVEAIPMLIDGIVQAFTAIVEALPTLVQTICDALPTLIPKLIDGIITMIVTLCENFSAIIMPIVEALPDILISIVEALMNNLPALIGGLITLVLGIVDAIPVLIQGILEALPTIIGMLIEGILGCLPQLLMGLLQAVMGIVTALPDILMSLIEAVINIFIEVWGAIQNVFAPVGEFFGEVWQKICDAFASVVQWFKDLFANAWQGIKDAFASVGNFFSSIWSGIQGAFSNVTNWFKDIFSKAWQGVKNVFSTGGKIFDGIKDGIANVFKTVVNGIIGGINKVIKVPFDAINSMLRKLKGIDILGVKPFGWIKEFNVPQIPKLAKGGIIDSATLAVVGERGREAVMPLENNLEWLDKLAKMLNDRMGGNSKQPIVLKVGEKVFGEIAIDSINNITKQTGQIKLVVV